MKFSAIIEVDESDFDSKEQAHAYVTIIMDRMVRLSEKDGVYINVKDLKVIN